MPERPTQVDVEEEVLRMESEGGPSRDDEPTSNPRQEQNNEPAQSTVPAVQVGPHPLGGILVRARGADDSVVLSRILINEASDLVSHLQALITMAYANMYNEAQQQAQQASEIIIPGR
jgi:hypothetical protein